MATTENGDANRTALLDRELSGLDHLETALPSRRSRAARIWAAAWPKLLAVAIVLIVWQLVVWSGWKPEYVLPGPRAVWDSFVANFSTNMDAAWTTLQRGFKGFAFALVIGTIVGALVARNRVLRSAIGSLITGLQTMPSVAWFPLAILLFKLGEGAIFFVVVLGAAPSIANGLISGIDHIQPILLRAGTVLGARRWKLFRYVILPAALPSFVAGLKQGWAFAWRSLLAGELIVLIPGQFSLGQQLDANRQLSDSAGVIAVMIVILIIGILVDALLFGTADRAIRRRYGLVDTAAAN
ncbi:MAG TPA: ABC transporter permease [Acidimicrobiia bacterium]|nr:ABC transporter permease [Acidimicrobiia bacterium]